MADRSNDVKLIYGTMTIGASVSEADAREQLKTFFASENARQTCTANGQAAKPLVYLDTASLYEDGKTEKILGKILTQEQRDSMYLATKANPWNKKGLKPESVIEQLNTSLRSLGLASVDLFYLHAPDPKTPIEATLQAVKTLHDQGKFKELGLSNFSAADVGKIYDICKGHGWVVPTVYQGMYNALTRAVEPELFPRLRELGMRFYAFNPLAGGILTGKYADFAQQPTAGRFVERKHYQQRFWKQSYFQAVDTIKQALEGSETTLTNASLAWLRRHSLLDGSKGDGVIIGQSSLEHLKANIVAFEQAPLSGPVVEAFEKGWAACQKDCPPYYR